VQARIERLREQGKRDEEHRHKQEIEGVKQRYLQKLQIEKEKI